MTSPSFELGSGSSGERLDEFERFVEYWLGPRQSGYGVPADVLATLELPEPLRRFYAFLGNWPGSPMSAQNVLRPPQTLADQKGAAVGLVEFAVENQGVYRWATMAEGDDPPVYSAEHWDDLPDGTALGDYPAPGWYEWDRSLTSFLIGYAITELALAPAPGARITWSPSLERYAESPEANVVVLRRSAAGEPLSILVDGDYLLDGRDHDRWTFCAARSADSAAALERFNGELDRLAFNYGKSLPLGQRSSRDWFVDVWATGAVRVRHHPVDEWLPPGTVDVDALFALLHDRAQAPADCVEATVKRLGVADTSASITVTDAEDLFDSIIEGLPARPGTPTIMAAFPARTFAMKHPPAVLARGPSDIATVDDLPPLRSATAAPRSPLGSKAANQAGEGNTIVVRLDDWTLSVHAAGSGAISWKRIQAPFGAGAIDVTEAAAQLRSGNIPVEHPPIDVPFLTETLEDFVRNGAGQDIRENLEDLKAFGEQAVRRTFKAAVRIADATPSTHAVDPLVVEALWNQALDAAAPHPRALKLAAEAAPPDFTKAAAFRHTFSVEHPDVHAAR